MGTEEVVKSGDKQQYEAEPHQGDPDRGVEPKVSLLWMTPDPLGVLAATTAIYSGRVVRSLSDVTDAERYQALIDMQNTHLTGPLEVIEFHLLLEGVDRAFTHQEVRQRTAFFAQESMRFAVLGDLIDATTLPPSLQGTKRSSSVGDCGYVSLEELRMSKEYELASPEDRKRALWDWTLQNIDEVYHLLVGSGMAAEEARGLLPHCTATRIHHKVDLRNLTAEAGKRLCTQAQFHWRLVFSQIVQQIREYGTRQRRDGSSRSWQYEALADSGLFRPVCYQLGRCPYDASFDRACSIRDRVQANADINRPSREWSRSVITGPADDGVSEINPAEWLLDPGAARL